MQLCIAISFKGRELNARGQKKASVEAYRKRHMWM